MTVPSVIKSGRFKNSLPGFVTLTGVHVWACADAAQQATTADSNDFRTNENIVDHHI